MNTTLAILLVFMVINLGVGLYHPKKKEKAASASGSSAISDYYAANRSIQGWVVGIVVAATMISGGSLIATPGLIWSNGLCGAAWQQHGLWYGLLGTAILGKRLSVLGTRVKANSIPHLLGIRYGEPTRIITAAMIVCILFASTAMQYSASARVLQSASGFAYETCVILIGVVMTLYLAFGGAKAQAWTNVIQAAFMTAGLFAIAVAAAGKFGITNMINTMGEMDQNLITLPGVNGYLSMGVYVSYSLILMACIGISRPETNSRYLTMKKGSPYRSASFSAVSQYSSGILACTLLVWQLRLLFRILLQQTLLSLRSSSNSSRPYSRALLSPVSSVQPCLPLPLLSLPLLLLSATTLLTSGLKSVTKRALS